MREHFIEENQIRSVVGFRPYRRGSVRLECEELGAKRWIHNYGHGGSGITLCWGSAKWVTQALEGASGSVAVLGAGAIGLTVAHRLLKAGFRVTIYARDFPPHTTSDLAGGLWAPTHIAINDPSLRRNLLEWSWKAFQEIEGDDYGVWRIKLFQALDSPYPLDPMPAWLVGEGETVERLPFGPQAPRGIVWNTYLIQTSTFLAKLVEEVKTFGGSLVERSFSSVTEVEDLSQPIVVNCLGLGAGKLLSDEAVVPIRGQLIHVKPVPGRRMVVDHAGGYLISRDDILVLGGTFEEGVVDPTPSPEAVRKIWDGNKSFDWD